MIDVKNNRFLMGVDIGTSSSKVLIIDANGHTVATSSTSYEIQTPKPGYAEQDANLLRNAAFQAIRHAVQLAGGADTIAAVGITGQMHGLVALGADNLPLRPVIIWADQRSTKEIEMLRSLNVEEITMNPAATGFLFPSLLWVKENEPEVFSRIKRVMFPKDYVRLCLTDVFGTDYSDASGSLLFNPRTISWDKSLLEATGVPEEIFPTIHNASEIAGCITEWAAEQTGLTPGTPVVFGGGDSPMLLTGNGVVSEGEIATNIGTASQISCICKDPPEGWEHLNAFHHVSNGFWISTGASLNGGLVLKWARDVLMGGTISFQEMDRLAEESTPGSNGVVFLPFLCGERAPYLDPNAKAVLHSLKLSNTRADIVRSVMESVVYSFRDCMEYFHLLGLKMGNVIVASGGGVKSPVWLQMQADILKKKVVVRNEAIEAAMGAAITAGVSIGIYDSFADATAKTGSCILREYLPNEENFAVYDQRFETYRKIYQNNKEIF